VTKATSILIVDDIPPKAITLADILDAKGFIVYSALSGAQALQVLVEPPIDILLTDIKMPDMDGITLYRQIRKPYPHLVAFLMTAFSAGELIQKGTVGI
jgi:two-component system, NtrC family, response regulator HydG